MPAADDQLIPDLDDVDLSPPRQSPADAEPNWGATLPSKKSKKKKKGARHAEALSRSPEGDFGETVAAVATGEGEDGVRIGSLGDEPVKEDVKASLLDVNGVEASPEADNMVPIAPRPPSLRPSTSPATSPRPAYARPVSSSISPSMRPASLYQPPQNYPYANRPYENTATRARRPSQPSPAQRFVEPVAPPHKAQPHFYGLPDFGLNSKPEPAGKAAAGSHGYCCSFDSLADSGDYASARKARNALLVGSEGGLEVYRVLPNKFEVVGRLEGLRGAVIGAKILPGSAIGQGLRDMTPLVAVIAHGVACNVDSSSVQDGHSTYYQTTVEVYSLRTQEYVTTLFQSTAIALEQPMIGQLTTIPGPIGDLSVAAQGKFITVISGKSGEIFVFTSVETRVCFDSRFRCIGKFWTSLQSSLDRPASRPQSASEGGAGINDVERKAGVPLFSISQRWLAIVPPATSSHISIQATLSLTDANPSPPGVASHVAPPQPSITCDIAGVDAEGTFGRLSRQAAQGLVKVSQRGFELGRQGWNELVNPTNQANAQQGRAPANDEQFPPTKAPPDDPRRLTKEPAVVSIVDLQALLDAEELRPKYPPAPIATFALEEGCNHLSLSSTGLRLLAVSRSGEVSTVWDLKQASHGSYHASDSSDGDEMYTPCIKQLARIPRSSQAVVTDSAWSRDDEYLAMLSNHGTVHLHEIPAYPASRKRKRKVTPVTSGLDKAQATVSVTHGSSPPSSNANATGGLFGTLRSGISHVSSSVRTQAPAVSSFALPTFAGFREATASAGQAGTRALARGLSEGYKAARSGAVDYWHADDNKIRHKQLQDVSNNGRGCIRWLKRPSGMLLAVACGGTVHLHPVARVERRRADGVASSGLKHDRYSIRKFELPVIRTSEDSGNIDPMQERRMRTDDCSRAGPHGFWSLHLSPDVRHPSPSPARVGAQVDEVETNPPYCPFHIDSRVNIYAFDDGMNNSQIHIRSGGKQDATSAFLSHGHGQSREAPWVFGEKMPPSTRMNTHEELPTHDISDEGVTDSDLEAVAEQVESRLTIKSSGEGGGDEIRVHTRRASIREVEAIEDDDEEI
jgi:hypothetical protein